MSQTNSNLKSTFTDFSEPLQIVATLRPKLTISVVFQNVKKQTGSQGHHLEGQQ